MDKTFWNTQRAEFGRDSGKKNSDGEKGKEGKIWKARRSVNGQMEGGGGGRIPALTGVFHVPTTLSQGLRQKVHRRVSESFSVAGKFIKLLRSASLGFSRYVLFTTFSRAAATQPSNAVFFLWTEDDGSSMRKLTLVNEQRRTRRYAVVN